MIALVTSEPETEGALCATGAPTPPGCSVGSRELLDDLIGRLVQKRNRIEALRKTMPNEMTPDAVEAFCNIGGKPGAAISGSGVKFLLAETRDKVERDIDALCALRRNLPEEFASELAENGLALLLVNFCYCPN